MKKGFLDINTNKFRKVAVVLALTMLIFSKSVAGGNDSLKQRNSSAYSLFPNGNFISDDGSLLINGSSGRPLWSEVPLAVKPVKIPFGAPEYSFVKPVRLALVSGVAFSTLGGLYLYLKNVWWKDQARTFHLNREGDYTYALNADKFGHFYATILLADGFGTGLQWAGVNHQSSLLYGAALGSFVQLVAEMADGFAPAWGFSLGDAGADVVGAFYPFLQSVFPVLKNFNFKLSYWPTRDSYYKSRQMLVNKGGWTLLDDYEGQT